jgi:hypothetical protein
MECFTTEEVSLDTHWKNLGGLQNGGGEDEKDAHSCLKVNSGCPTRIQSLYCIEWAFPALTVSL